MGTSEEYVKDSREKKKYGSLVSLARVDSFEYDS